MAKRRKFDDPESVFRVISGPDAVPIAPKPKRHKIYTFGDTDALGRLAWRMTYHTTLDELTAQNTSVKQDTDDLYHFPPVTEIADEYDTFEHILDEPPATASEYRQDKGKKDKARTKVRATTPLSFWSL